MSPPVVPENHQSCCSQFIKKLLPFFPLPDEEPGCSVQAAQPPPWKCCIIRPSRLSRCCPYPSEIQIWMWSLAKWLITSCAIKSCEFTDPLLVAQHFRCLSIHFPVRICLVGYLKKKKWCQLFITPLLFMIFPLRGGIFLSHKSGLDLQCDLANKKYQKWHVPLFIWPLWNDQEKKPSKPPKEWETA